MRLPKGCGALAIVAKPQKGGAMVSLSLLRDRALARALLAEERVGECDRLAAEYSHLCLPDQRGDVRDHASRMLEGLIRAHEGMQPVFTDLATPLEDFVF
jgi:hypothetical protein